MELPTGTSDRDAPNGTQCQDYASRDACGVYMETIMLDDEGREIFARIKRGEF